MTSRLQQERDHGAHIWATQLGMGETLFREVAVGQRFVFQKDDCERPHCILLRTKTGYRHEIGGRIFKTGARTACFLLKPKPEIAIPAEAHHEDQS